MQHGKIWRVVGPSGAAEWLVAYKREGMPRGCSDAGILELRLLPAGVAGWQEGAIGVFGKGWGRALQLGLGVGKHMKSWLASASCPDGGIHASISYA